MKNDMPQWTQALTPEDWQFLKRFLLASGSLKALADAYDISYPTIRGRLDRLIAKVRAADQPDAVDSFHQQLRIYVAEGRMDAKLARALLLAHRRAADEQAGDSGQGGESNEV